LAAGQDMHTIDLKDFKYSRAQIYSYRLTNENNTELRKLIHEWNYYAKELQKEYVETPHNMKVV